MSSALGAQFGVLYPAALLALPLFVAALIYAYFRRGQGVRVPVASILLLQLLKSEAVSRQRFVPPPRFFFELLLLLLLAAGAAGLFRRQQEQRVAVLLDNSFSMAARAVSGYQGRTLLEQTGKQANQILDSLGSEVKVEVFVASPALRSVTGGLTRVSSARSAIESVELAYASDNLAAAMQRLAANSTYERIVVLSDKHSQTPEEDSVEVDRRVDYRAVGVGTLTGSRNNVAISDVSVGGSSLDTEHRKLSIKIASYSSRQTELILQAEYVQDSAVQGRRSPGKQELSLEPGQSQSIEFSDIPREVTAVRIQAEVKQPTELKADAIAEDNTAWVSFGAVGRRAVFVGELTPQQVGLHRIAAMRFEHLSPQRYQAEAQTAVGSASDLYLFHRFAPVRTPQRNSFYIVPPPDAPPFAARPSQTAGAATSWQESHPLLSYLNVPALQVESFSPLTVPVWGRPVMRAAQGALLVAGEQRGVRYVGTGFEILPYEGRQAPVLSILLLNALNWLSASGLQVGYQATHTVLAFNPDVTEVGYVGGAQLYKRGAAGDIVRAEHSEALLPVPGLVRIKHLDGSRRLVAVNFFDEQESNLLRQPAAELPVLEVDQSRRRVPRSFAGLLALLCLLLLLGDMTFTIYRSARA